MAGGKTLDIKIVEARLVRIFDSLKPHQDVFVQLVCGYEDGSEKEVKKTDVCKFGNLRPQWNQTFVCNRDPSSGAKTLKFKVFVDHVWRTPVLCGEAEFSLDSLWSRASSGRVQEVPVPLYKKGEQTGVLQVTIALHAASPSPHSGGPVNGFGMALPVGREPEPQGGDRHSSGRMGDSSAGILPVPGVRDHHANAPLAGYASGGYASGGGATPFPEQLMTRPPAPVREDEVRRSTSLAASVGAHEFDASAPWLQKSNTQELREQAQRERQLQQLQEQQRQQQLQEQQLREQQLREQQLREQQLREQQLREQHLREQQQLRERQLREQQMNQQRQPLPPQQSVVTQAGALSAAEQVMQLNAPQERSSLVQQQPERRIVPTGREPPPPPPQPSDQSTPQTLMPPSRQQPPEVRGGSCGWCQRGERSPKPQSSAMPGSQSPNERVLTPDSKSPTGSSPGPGVSGQWWNSFIDRG